MGLRETAKAEAAQPAPEETPQDSQGAPGPRVAAAEQEALRASVERAQALERSGGRTPLPDANVYYPEHEVLGNGQNVIGKNADRAALVPATPGWAAPPPAAPRLVMGTPLQLTEQQYRVLLAPLNPNRVGNKQGQSHLEAWDVRRYLTKIFGFGGWNVQTLELTKIYEKATPPGEGLVTRWTGPQGNRTKNKVPNDDWMFTVVYQAQVRLTIYNPDGTVGAFYEDGATGDGINMPTYQQAADFALKTALSQALKRCAVNLGDQFGLSLYNHGSAAPQVELTLRPPTWENLPEQDDATIQAAVSNERVRGEEQPGEGVTEDPGEESGVNGLPDAKELRDEALEPDTSLVRLRQIYAMINRKKGDHPEIGQQVVINETGDEEPLDYLIYRKIQDAKAAGGAADQPGATG